MERKKVEWVKGEKRRKMKKTKGRNPRTGEGALVPLEEVCCQEQTEQSDLC